MKLKSDVEEYFEKLGYKVDWDYNRRLGEQWWEIIEPTSNKMIAQIDQNVPIFAIVEDLICLREQKDTTSSYEYKICAPDSPEFDILLEKIYEKQN